MVLLRKLLILPCTAGVLLLVACTSLISPKVTTGVTELRAGEYRLDPAHSTLLFKIGHLGLSEYVGRFNDIDATLDFDPARFENSKLEAVIHTGSIDVNDPKFEEELRGRDWFDTASYPEAVFRSTSARLVDENTANFDGELTMLGRTVPVALSVFFNGGANNLLTLKYTVGFYAETRFRRSDFGIDHYTPAVSDEVKIEVYAEFQRG